MTLVGRADWCFLLRALASTAKLDLLSLPDDNFLSLSPIEWLFEHQNLLASTTAFYSLLVLSGSMFATLSIFSMGVVFIPPVIIRNAWFWTLSRVWGGVLAAVIQALDPYSRCGLTVSLQYR